MQGQELNSLRTDLNLTMFDLARLLGTTHSSLSRWDSRLGDDIPCDYRHNQLLLLLASVPVEERKTTGASLQRSLRLHGDLAALAELLKLQK